MAALTGRGAGLLVLLCQAVSLKAETITGHIYCDNYFEFYFNGQLVQTDPLQFTPHNAVKVSFEYDGSGPKVYAIMCQDYASDSGYEYLETSNPQLGDGALLAEFSDGTRTSRDWKAYTVTYGPTDASVSAGCSGSNLAACSIQDNGMPTDWFSVAFDDSAWVSATEYTTRQAGWGRAPTYQNGECGTITSPLTSETASPSSIPTTADECLNPKNVLCGGDQTCSADEGQMIWGSDLEKDNKMLFRYSASSASSGSSTTASSAATCTDPGVAACTAPKAASQRVRRELGSLSQAEWQKVVDAIWTMKNTSMADGISRYGSGFKTYDYFVTEHASLLMDSRGDQGHFSSAFATWHAAFCLEFELALLAVDPSVGALPYWNATWDPLTEEYFGSPTGTGPNKEVLDGKFANFPITSNFNSGDYSAYMGTVAGASGSFSGNGGFLRGQDPANPLQTSVMTRYGRSWTFPAAGQDECATESGCWMDWYSCIDGGSSFGNFHGGLHKEIGGSSGSFISDLADPSTSPNDPIFWFHHVNLDRNRLDWMARRSAEASVYWGYETQCIGQYARRGCPTGGISLTNVASGLWPFSSQQLGLSGSAVGLTHADILCLIGPETAPYRYDASSVQTAQTTARSDESNTSPDSPDTSTSADGTPDVSSQASTSAAGKILTSVALLFLLCSRAL